MSPQYRNVEPSPARSEAAKPTPKERGCYQCMRRRIVCDKAEPSCGKCIKKGIECAGINRIRFTDSVARRGKLKDCKIPDASGNNEVRLPTTVTFSEVRWPAEKKKVIKRTREAKKKATTHDVARTLAYAYPSDAVNSVSTLPLTVKSQHSYICTTPTDLTTQSSADQDASLHDDHDIEEVPRTTYINPHHSSTFPTLQPWLAPIDNATRMLFSYFSSAIAPVMVVLDTASNGYRQIVLPMALENDVLRRAVGVVAAQHLSRVKPELQSVAETGRAAIISRLRSDALSATPDKVFSKFTWATLIVLLVGETVTGSTDYKFLVQMLLCLSADNRAEDLDETAINFLQTQTNMFELLSLPLRSEDTGVLGIKESPNSWQKWLTCEHFPAETESHRIIDKIRLCFAVASRIYIRRATMTDTSSSQVQQAATQDLLNRMAHIPPHTPGAHALVWPCFVAGAEAEDPGQRAFCVEYMCAIYARTRFRNVPVAVQSLKELWAKKGERRWTQCLSEFSRVLIM